MPTVVRKRSKSYKILKNNAFLPKSIGSAFAFLTLVTYAGPAWSNVKSPGDEKLSILTRYNPSYDPEGLRVGNLIVHSGISSSTQYNDNVYATNVNKMHDMLFTIKPQLSVRSDFARHEITASVSAERGLYHDLTSENFTNYSALVSGRVDIGAQTSLPITASYIRDHIRRGSPDDRASKEPTVYKVMDSTIGLVNKGQTLALKAIADVKRVLYDDAKGISGTIDNGDQNRNEYSLYTSIGMAEEALFAPYIYSNVKKISYMREADNNGFQRDSDEYEVGVGSFIHISNITRASFNIGYLNRDMSDSRFSNIGTYTYGMNLIWEPSTLAAFILKGNRTVDESIVSGAAASISSTADLSMNYELFPNVTLIPSIGYQKHDYQDIDRTVESISTGLEMTYKLNPNVWLSSSYKYMNQYNVDGSSSDDDDDKFDNNIYSLSLNLQF